MTVYFYSDGDFDGCEGDDGAMKYPTATIGTTR
jgi:hypothetical protein